MCDRASCRTVARMSLRSRLLLLLAAACCACCAAGAAASAAVLSPNVTLILSGAPSLLAPLPAPVATSIASPHSVSDDGTMVAFASASDDLSSEDDDDILNFNIYVKNMTTGVVTLVSRRSGLAGAPADSTCEDPAISGDGTRVAFVCDGALDPADTNGVPDIYVRDLRSGQTILASRASGADGMVGNRISSGPVLDRQGTHVAFASASDDLGVPSLGTEVYVRDVPLDPQQSAGGATALVSRPDPATGQPLPAHGASSQPSISGDGTKVAFVSSDDNLVANDTNHVSDVFVRTLGATPTTELVSRNSAGDLEDHQTRDATISGDGTKVAFTSDATNLNTGDTDNFSDVYVRTLGATPATTLVDVADGGKANSVAHAPAIDDHGDVVAFASAATNLDPADGDRADDVYVADLHGAAPVVSLASRAGASGPANNGPVGVPSLSGDGTKVLIESVGSLTGDVTPHVRSLALRTIAGGAMASASRPGIGSTFANQGGSGFGSVSADGRFVALQTTAPALGVAAGARDTIVRRDTLTGATVLVSRADGPNGAPMAGEAFDPAISADGQRIAFEAYGQAGDLSTAQVWVRDVAKGTTTLASRADGAVGAPGNDGSGPPSISADGTRVAFESHASNLSPDDTDTTSDIYVRDLAKGTTVLADRANGAGGVKADQQAFGASISADGAHVAFYTTATNLGNGTSGDNDEVFVRDLASAATRPVSVGSDGKEANANAIVVSGPERAISADGSRVAFASGATNLGTAIPSDARGNAIRQAWVRDLRAGTTILASRANGAAGAPSDGPASNPALSANGGAVAFEAASSNLGGGSTPTEIYRRDLTTNTTQLVSRAGGRDGAPARLALLPDLTADGGCVVFSGYGDLLGPVPGALDFSQAYLRTFEADCGMRPALSAVKLSHARFRVGKTRTAVSASAAAAKKKPAKRKPKPKPKPKARPKPVPRGTVLTFTGSAAGKLTLLIERARSGQKVRKGKGKSSKVVCRATRRKVKRSSRCTLYVRAATLTRNVRAGHGRVALSGRIGRRAMAAGSYRVTLTLRDAAGVTSVATRRSFTILRG
jgi:Tol biopolymer transport system component